MRGVAPAGEFSCIRALHQMILRLLTRRHEDAVQSAALGRSEALATDGQSDLGRDGWAAASYARDVHAWRTP
eukprot:scaffold116265_cov36-Phaeocystis_antarctica.AAC.1